MGRFNHQLDTGSTPFPAIVAYQGWWGSWPKNVRILVVTIGKGDKPDLGKSYFQPHLWPILSDQNWRNWSPQKLASQKPYKIGWKKVPAAFEFNVNYPDLVNPQKNKQNSIHSYTEMFAKIEHKTVFKKDRIWCNSQGVLVKLFCMCKIPATSNFYWRQFWIFCRYSSQVIWLTIKSLFVWCLVDARWLMYTQI